MGQRVAADDTRDTATALYNFEPNSAKRSQSGGHSRRYWRMITSFVSELRIRSHNITDSHVSEVSWEYNATSPTLTFLQATRASGLRTPSLPVELYKPILLLVASAPNGRKELMKMLTVSKAMAREVQRIIYHTLIITPDGPQPTFPNDMVARMVHSVEIRLGNYFRTAQHTHWCLDLLPRLLCLETIVIRGRGWEVSVFDSCLPRPWDFYEGVTSIRSFTFDGTIDLPVIRFLAAQRDLTELEIVSSVSVPFSSADVLEIVSTPYPNLRKVTIPHAYAKAIIRLAPALKHLSLTFDFSARSSELAETLTLLPPTLHSLFLNTSRRDFLPAHEFLPRGLRTLSTVLILNESEQFLKYLAPLHDLETVVLNVYQLAVPLFINPWTHGSVSAPSSPTPIQTFDDFSTAKLVSELKIACPSVKNVEVDNQVFNRTGSIWMEESDGSMSHRSSYEIGRNREGSTARLWRMSV
jgi:hypothetical protein